MGVSTIEELRAWQLARAFKLEVYRLIRESPDGRADYRFKSQLADAAAGAESNIAEGFRRFHAADFTRFLTYAGASIEEATRRVQDGIDRGYFDERDCASALRLGVEAGKTTMALRTSVGRFVPRRGPNRGQRTKD